MLYEPNVILPCLHPPSRLLPCSELVEKLRAEFCLVQQVEEQAQRPQRRDRIPLHHFLRLIGGGRVIERDVAADNDELVTNLKRSGVIIQ